MIVLSLYSSVVIYQLVAVLALHYVNYVYGMQVFPLILQHFSDEEQASLVWQFMCSIPLVLLEDLLPWTMSFLPPDEQEEVIHCIKEIVPDEKSLQEVDSDPKFLPLCE